ncbi:hypothetical protein BRETT_000921 [Brettanomyces bruxellensis]|uniref:Uncharacterized protein n=1 Tax=Dekkera bruxellensis TaxID=5007 RepID=A0A871RGM3_DEKBR|nr:uncharacterized protein BRETT_000921 [Brettanomyces bruxellensis]QOU21200.1 hypothetical protein BRETT_000921 [Brettanomyces bruxellensis]
MKAQLLTTAVYLHFRDCLPHPNGGQKHQKRKKVLLLIIPLSKHPLDESSSTVETSSWEESPSAETTSVKTSSCEESTSVESSSIETSSTPECDSSTKDVPKSTPECDSSTKETPSSIIPTIPTTKYVPPHSEIKNETSCETKTTVITTSGTLCTTGYKVITTTGISGTTVVYTTLCPLPSTPVETSNVVISTSKPIPATSIFTSAVYHNITSEEGSTAPAISHFEGVGNLQKASCGAALIGVAAYLLL